MMQRRKYVMSRERFISILFRQQQSGLSIADFCETEGYSRSRFYLWKQKYGITELLHAEPGGLVLYEKLLEEGTFKIPAYDPATHFYPMTRSDLVVMVDGINEDVSKGRQRRLFNLKKHW